MGVDYVFKEFFSENNKRLNDFELYLQDYEAEYFFNMLGILSDTNINIKFFVDKLTHSTINEEPLFLNLNELKEFHDILKKIIHTNNFKEKYLEILDKRKDKFLPWYLAYDYRIKKFEGIIQVRCETINKFPNFILEFLSLLIENNSGIECKIMA